MSRRGNSFENREFHLYLIAGARCWIAGALVFGAMNACASDPDGTGQSTDALCLLEPGDIFEQRIRPLLASDRPSSCNECHLSGIDLALFARDNECETMACLEADGLVDFDAPDESVILDWIARANPETSLITAEVRQEEYEGMRDWIRYRAECASDQCAAVTCSSGRESSACADGHDREGETPEIDPSDCSPEAIDAAFLENVFAWRGRCSPCHVENAPRIPDDYPRWIYDSDNCETASLLTQRRLVERALVDFLNPEASLILVKPLSERYAGAEHGGGNKFADPNDEAYQDFEEWIRYAASCGLSN